MTPRALFGIDAVSNQIRLGVAIEQKLNHFSGIFRQGGGGAWGEPTDAVGNSGRTMDFILCDLPEFWQQIQIGLLRGDIIQTRMRSLIVVPVKVLDQVCPSRAHAVVGHKVNVLPIFIWSSYSAERERRFCSNVNT